MKQTTEYLVVETAPGFNGEIAQLKQLGIEVTETGAFTKEMYELAYSTFSSVRRFNFNERFLGK